MSEDCPISSQVCRFMLARKYLFPRVIEMNYQAGRRLGVNLYLIDGGSEWLLIDIGYLDTVDEVIDLIRCMDFSLSACKMIVATTPTPTTSRAWPAPASCSKPRSAP